MRFVFSIVVPLAMASAAYGQQQPPAPVVVSPIIERQVASGQTFVGTVMPLKMAVIGSAVDGRVVDFPLDEGDRVEQGQVLARLLTETIKLELQGAEAEADFRRQELAELENGSRPEELEQAKARMIAADARMKYMRARRARLESLYRNNRATTEEDRDEAVSAAVEAEQAYEDIKAAFELVVQGPRLEKIAQARAQVAMQDAMVDKLKDQIKKHEIISRFDGYLTAQHTEVGQWVKQGDPVAEVAALDEVEILAHVVEKHIAFVHVGTEVRVEIPALPDRIFTGQVVLVVPQADVRARTFPVKIRVENEITPEGPVLKSGMYARVTLPTGTLRQALLVPKDALVLGGPQTLVFVVDSAGPGAREGKARPVPVDLGIASGRWIQVSGSLAAGQRVVVQGNERLRPGQEVVVDRTVVPDADGALSSDTAAQ